MATEQTVKPEDLREGDRVRVTFEGVIDDDGDLGFQLETGTHYVMASTLKGAALVRLSRPLAEGDDVRYGNGRYGKIKAIAGGMAWVFAGGGYVTRPLSSLTRIEPEG